MKLEILVGRAWPAETKRAVLIALAEGLTRANVELRQRHPGRYPRLYDSGWRYRREPPGREWWETVEDLRRIGHGDCEDLAAALASEERARGVYAWVDIVDAGPGTWHAIVRYPDGSTADPSRDLYLPPLTSRGDTMQKGSKNTIRFGRAPDGAHTAAVAIKTTAGHVVTAEGHGSSKAEALVHAGHLAERLLADPMVQAIIPPQAVVMINAAKGIGTAAMAGALPAAHALIGGARRLAHLLRGH